MTWSKNIFAIAVGVVTLLTACSKRDKGYIEDTDPEMAAAIAKAQATLPQFWQVFDTRERGESNFVLTVRITDKGRVEHFHTTEFERRDGQTIVTINNPPKILASVKARDRIEIPAADITDWRYISRAPEIVAGVKLGNRIAIPAADITDWHYMRDGKYVGMFTMKPRFRRMPADQVEQFKKALADP